MQCKRLVIDWYTGNDWKVRILAKTIKSCLLIIMSLVFLTCWGISITLANESPLSQDIKKEIIDSISTRLENEYVFLDTARAMIGKIKGLEKSGNYNEITSLEQFLEQVQKDLKSVYDDQHLRVGTISQHGVPPSLEDEIPSEQKVFWNELYRFENYGVRAATRLDGNIGYIDFRLWPESALVSDRILAAMSLLRDVDALIIDVRYHMGGRTEPATLVISHLFDQPIHFVNSINRLKNTQVGEWTNYIEDKGSLSEIPIWVLISGETVSGGELLPFVLKNYNRATIVGSRTRGAGLRTHRVVIPNMGFEMYISHAADVNPSSGLGWEGIGVAPDIEVPAADALVYAHLAALEYLTENTASMLPTAQPERDWAIVELRATLNDQHPFDDELEKYVGTFGTKRILVRESCLCYQKDADSEILRLNHMIDDWFEFESDNLYYVRLRFESDHPDKADKLIMCYDNGKETVSEKIEE